MVVKLQVRIRWRGAVGKHGIKLVQRQVTKQIIELGFVAKQSQIWLTHDRLH